jgi:O-antigen ligase
MYALCLALALDPVPSLRVAGIPVQAFVEGVLLFLLFFRICLRRWVPMPSLLSGGYALILAAATISTGLAYSRGLGVSVSHLLRTIAYALLPLVAIQAIQRPEQLRRCLLTIAAVSLGLTVYGFYGFLTGSVGLPVEHTFGYFGLHYIPATRNTDALYLVTGVVIILAHALYRPWGPLRGYLLAGPAVVGIVLSQSRSAWLSLAAGVVVLHWLRYRMLGGLFRVLVVAVLFGGLMWTVMPERYQAGLAARLALFRSLSAASNEERLQLYQGSFLLLLKHPLGVGAGNFSVYIEKEVGLGHLNHAENTFLNVAVELGLVGLLGFVMLTILPMRNLVESAAVAEDRRDWILPALASLGVSWFVALMFNTTTDFYLFWLVNAVLVAGERLYRAPARQNFRSVARTQTAIPAQGLHSQL